MSAGRFRRTAGSSVAVVSASLAGCCFSAPPPASTPAAAVSVVPAPASSVVPITLAPGFAPQPTTELGNAFGGAVDALNLDRACRGLVLTQPQHALAITAPIPALTVAVNTRGPSGAVFDATLVIRAPDGTYLCDDDTEGRDPRVRAAFAPGRYDIYVGSYGSASIPANADYVLGVSESELLPSALPEPPEAAR